MLRILHQPVAYVKILTMVGFLFTKQVKLRIEQRKIEEIKIKETLQNPDQILPGQFGRSLARKYLNGKTLEVVFVKRGSNFIIITAYFLKGGGNKSEYKL